MEMPYFTHFQWPVNFPCWLNDAPDGHTSKEGGTQPDEHRDEHEPPGVVTEEGAIELVFENLGGGLQGKGL